MIETVSPELEEKIKLESERLFDESKEYVLHDQLENWVYLSSEN